MANPKYTYTIALATPTTHPAASLMAIEVEANDAWAHIPDLAVFTGTHAPEEMYNTWLSEGTVFVAHDEAAGGKAVGFVAIMPMDGVVYVAEISTAKACQGRGVGSALMAKVFEYARSQAKESKSKARISLTTFREITWNKPWYVKRGFREVEAETLGEAHVEKMRSDREERGLWRGEFTRCCMLWEDDVEG